MVEKIDIMSECDEIEHVTNIVTNCDGVVAFPTDTLYGIACSIQSQVGFGMGILDSVIRLTNIRTQFLLESIFVRNINIPN